MSVASEGLVTRSRLADLTAPDFFLWATGIEDTFITDPHRRTRRTLDEYELTQHYSHWREDVDLIASLGVRYARYGIPWYRIEGSPGRFDFSWTDEVFARLLANGIQPIVDLVHYGTPAWLEGGFANPEYPERVAEYARRTAERYRGRVFWYTPLNEPRITAYYCGRLGWWPPYGRSWRGFTQVMLSIGRGIVLTQEALREVDPEIVCAHVDATDLYEPRGAQTEEEATFRQRLVFLALDLVNGRWDETHPLNGWLTAHGADDSDRRWFQERAVDLDVIGLNLYPMFTDKVVLPYDKGTRIRMRKGGGDLVVRLGRMYSERYGRPLFISETAAVGRNRRAWMEASFDAVRTLREEGVPLVGYTWWPLFSLIAWAYRERDLPFSNYLLNLGLWDLERGEAGRLDRTPTSLVQPYIEAVSNGIERIGRLKGRE